MARVRGRPQALAASADASSKMHCGVVCQGCRRRSARCRGGRDAVSSHAGRASDGSSRSRGRSGIDERRCRAPRRNRGSVSGAVDRRREPKPVPLKGARETFARTAVVGEHEGVSVGIRRSVGAAKALRIKRIAGAVLQTSVVISTAWVGGGVGVPDASEKPGCDIGFHTANARCQRDAEVVQGCQVPNRLSPQRR